MKSEARKTSLLMIELISAILIFAVCCTVCAGLFVEADRGSKNSARLTQAVLLAQNAAELLNGDYDRNLTAILGAKAVGDVYTAQFDGSWQPTSGIGRYGLVVSINQKTGVAEILVTDIGAEVYRLNAGLIDLDGAAF